MRIRPSAAVTLLAMLVSWAGPAVAAKLDDDDKKWLERVRPIMLADEEKTYKDLESKADREEFQKIFWARRDPDLSTPENEYQPEYEALREKANRDFRVPGRKGSLRAAMADAAADREHVEPAGDQRADMAVS